MAVDATSQTSHNSVSQIVDPQWKGLCSAGGVAALSMLALMIVQIVVFALWPPPTTVEGYLTLYNESWLLGLLSFDLLYIVDSVLLILIYLALYVVLRPTAPSAMLIAVVLGIAGVASYFASNPAFEMLSLSSQYAAATTETQRTMLLTAGHVMLEQWTGTAFDIYYVLNTIVLFIFGPVMLRSRLFSKAAAYLALAAGVLMIVPSSAGTLGLYFSLASLVPWAIWLVLIGRRLLRLARGVA